MTESEITDRALEDRKAPGARVRVPPPLLFATMLLIGAGLKVWLGGALSIDREVALPIAVVLVSLGAGLMLWAGGLFQKTGQDVRPWLNTPELIVSGVYKITRNPMYLAMALVQTGLGFGFRNPWLLALVPISMLLVYLTAIRHEEIYLEDKFQDQYRSYKKRVRRWL